MIRHGAELAFAYAEASVPRVCIVLRKAYGGAYIVMDSKGIGNDVCLAWPSARDRRDGRAGGGPDPQPQRRRGASAGSSRSATTPSS